MMIKLWLLSWSLAVYIKADKISVFTASQLLSGFLEVIFKCSLLTAWVIYAHCVCTVSCMSHSSITAKMGAWRWHQCELDSKIYSSLSVMPPLLPHIFSLSFTFLLALEIHLIFRIWEFVWSVSCMMVFFNNFLSWHCTGILKQTSTIHHLYAGFLQEASSF